MQTKPNQTTPGFRCLILEDDLNLAEVVAEAVNSAGGQAAIATTIEQAKALVALQVFQIFLLDHVLPDGKGSAFFSHLREQGVLAPCIMLTGVPEVQTAVELTRNGLFDYLTKPVALDRLLDCLQRAVAHGTAAQSSLQEFGLVDFGRGKGAVRRLL